MDFDRELTSPEKTAGEKANLLDSQIELSMRSLVIQATDAEIENVSLFGEKCSSTLQEVISKLQNDGFTVEGLVHGLTFPSNLTVDQKLALNRQLASAYRRHCLPVLGGDTSGGAQFLVVITLLIKPRSMAHA